MSRLWSRWFGWFYLALVAFQVPFIVGNVASGDYKFVALNIVAIALIGMAYGFVLNLERQRRSKVHEFQTAIVYSRQQDNEEMERYYMGLLAIWDGEPLPHPADVLGGEGSGGDAGDGSAAGTPPSDPS